MRNWLLSSNLTWGIWQILTWALGSPKNLHFNSLLLSKAYIAWAKKVQRSYLSWNWRGIQNLERNRLVVLKLTYGIWQLWPEHPKVSKIFTLIISFSAKYILFELKYYRGVIFHESEEGYKIWWGIVLFQNCHKEFDKFWPEHSKVSNIFT